MAWFSFDTFTNFLHWGGQKAGLTIDNVWLFEGFCCTERLENFSCIFIQNWYLRGTLK